jgi:transposase
MRLCYSRRLFVMAFPTQKQEAFFEGHVQAFHHFQGVPRRILQQLENRRAAHPGGTQPSGAADAASSHVRSGIVFRSHYLFESHFWTPGQGHEKGRVEKSIGFSRRNFMVPIPVVENRWVVHFSIAVSGTELYHC